MYSDKIEISSSRSDDDQFWRINRIYMLLGYAQALADIIGNEDFYTKISSIYDYKGMLTVTWLISPTKEEKEYLKKAWESAVTDYEANPIEHLVI